MNGTALHQLLNDHGLFIPATFAEYWDVAAFPQAGTWRGPDTWHRIDYIVYPVEWSGGTWTHGRDQVSTEGRNEDHIAVTECCSIQLHPQRAVHRKTDSIRYDKGKLRREDTCGIGSEMLKAFSVLHEQELWQSSPDQHVAIIHKFFAKQLPRHFPSESKKQEQAWIQDSTWELLYNSRWCRRQARQITARYQKAYLRHIMLAWRAEADPRNQTQPPPQPHLGWHFRMLGAAAKYAHHASQLRHRLADALRADEVRVVEEKLQQQQTLIGDVRPDALWKQLKCQLPKYRRRARERPAKFTATQDAFMTHFAAIEDAVAQPLAVINDIVTAQAPLALASAKKWDIPTVELPTLGELENVIHSLREGRAVEGLLTPELLHCEVPMAARILYPALLQFCAQAQQPFSWKGGKILPLWKRKGSLQQTQSYRSILVSHQHSWTVDAHAVRGCAADVRAICHASVEFASCSGSAFGTIASDHLL